MDLGRYLFSVAVVADTHMNEVEYGSSSPYEVNRIANARTRYVIERLNQIAPALTIHLGDLVHPVPGMPTYAQAAENFKALTASLKSPLHLVPGNHDVGDKPVAWAPAGIVSDAALALWRQHFGDHYYALDFQGLHFVVVDAQIINSGLGAEAEQRAWLERDLAASAGRRIFLCLHYPPYVSDPEESESYDNIAEPGRGWLLGLIERFRPEAVLAGHVHNFWYNRQGDTDCYILPSTAFVRQDYSELSRVAPVDGHGRDDTPKLGFFVVRIYERGHVCHVERTHGAGLDPGQALPPAPARVAALHTAENPRAPLGVDLRHPWTEVVEIPPMGALDEFERKRARNDYPLMAIWEMGLRKLRVPFQDLEDPRARARMRDLRRLGHAFTVYTLDVPRGRARDLLIEHHDLVDAWEVVCSWPEAARTADAVAEVTSKAPLVTLLSKLRTKEDVRREGSRYFHFINHGFLPEELPELEAFRSSGPAARAVDGFVFRVVRQASPWTAIAEAGAAAARLGARASVHVRMASTNPAETFTDDLANAGRAAEALAAALVAAGPGGREVDVFLDTFEDIDRGYFVRNGLVDRRFNPRLGSHVVRNLYAALNASAAPLAAGPRMEIPDGDVCLMSIGTEAAALVLPRRKLLVERVPRAGSLPAAGGPARVIDLATGRIEPLAWRGRGDALEIPGGRACASPALIVFGS